MSRVDIPQWALVYVVSFALLHLAIYYYYLRGEDDDGSAHRSLSGENGGDYPSGNPLAAENVDRNSERREFVQRAREDAEDGRRCPHCGTVNDSESAYTFCHNCVGRLGV